MSMKERILAALREQFEGWKELLAGLSEAQITTPHFDFERSVKDVMEHLWAWQQTSISRMESGVLNRAPGHPGWIARIGKDWEGVRTGSML